MQNPEFNCGLERVDELDDRRGQTFLERCMSRIHDFGEALELRERVDLELNGSEAAFLEGAVVWEYGDKKARIHYFVGGVQRSDEFCYTFKAYCEEDVVERFRPIFLAIWKSLRWFGEPQAALAERAQALDRLYGKSTRQTEKAPVRKEFELPAEGGSCFKVGGHEIKVESANLKTEICDSLHHLSVAIRVFPSLEMPNLQNVVNDPEVGLGFRMDFRKICAQGVPKGEFEFKNGRSESPDTYLWDDGWDYSLEFTGRVTLRDGWLAMHGAMGDQYEPDFEPLELEVYFPLPLEQSEWSNYRFGSLEETEGVEESLVRYLHLEGLQYNTFPQRVLQFRELSELTLTGGPQYPGRSQRMPLKQLPQELGELESLTTLRVNGVELQTLPESLGRLTRLEHLSVTHTAIERMPDSIWSLSALKHLTLFHNALAEVSNVGDLPRLVSLDLSNNALTRLPDWIGELAELRRLNLEGNPWQHLPEKLLDIEDFQLDYQDKMRLFDFSYPGAGGKGVVEWDDEKFFLRSRPERWDSFVRQLVDTEFSEFEKALRKVCKNTLSFEPVEGDVKPGETRFGGWPDLPPGVLYPRTETLGESYSCEFLAQINCQEVASLQDYLPRRGMLYFFISDQEDCEPQVLYCDAAPESLRPGAEAGFLNEFFNLPEGPYTPHRVVAKEGWSLPSDYASYCNSHYFPEEAQALSDQEGLTEEITEQLLGFEPQHRHEMNGYVFTQHESPELQAALKLRGRPEDWIVLLKVASLGDFQWCDAGDLFFVIHKSDLEKRDFSNVYCSLESS